MRRSSYRIIPALILAAIVISPLASCRRVEPTAAERRGEMVRAQIERRGITEPEILAAFREVPREEFVLPAYRDRAFDDIEAPIGFGESLDRAYDNAVMIRAMKIGPKSRVLEIGTGVGYLASIISRIAAEVFTIDIDPDIAAAARRNVEKLGYSNIKLKVGDGYLGWPDEAPFDAIVMTTSPSSLPAPLAEQLSEGGRLVVPIGGSKKHQELVVYTKKDGMLSKPVRLAPAEFSPMKGMTKD